jgi:phosphate transport system substrate-binding protein
MNRLLSPIAAMLLVAAFASDATARERIRIVGSSTVFPFSTAAAEEFGGATQFKTPVIESTGSGGGLKLFCAGVGVAYPDLTNASRHIKESEVERCAKNGVADITEVRIGFDGIVLANSLAAAPIDFSLATLFLALAKQVPDGKGGLVVNPHRKWSDIDPKLPPIRIEVLGPPPTSGTRDAFVELALEGGCKTFPAIKALKQTDKKKYKAVCQAIREDGAYVEAGENDNLIVQKLVANPDAFGIFGFSFLDQNGDRVRGNRVNGVAATFENIADGHYPISRSLYVYVKDAHVGMIPGIPEFLAELTGEEAMGPDGYLADKGLIPLPDAEREAVRRTAAGLTGARR